MEELTRKRSLSHLYAGQNSIKNAMAEHFKEVLVISNEIYPLIPEGSWKKFFDETEWRFLGENFVISYTQQQRLALAHSSVDGELIVEEFAKCNFNKLLEYLVWCQYLYLTFKLKHNPYPAHILISIKKMGFEEEKFSEELEKLQDIFAGILEITKTYPRSSSDSEGGRQMLLNFSWWTEEYRYKQLKKGIEIGVIVQIVDNPKDVEKGDDLPF